MLMYTRSLLDIASILMDLLGPKNHEVWSENMSFLYLKGSSFTDFGIGILGFNLNFHNQGQKKLNSNQRTMLKNFPFRLMLVRVFSDLTLLQFPDGSLGEKTMIPSLCGFCILWFLSCI